MKKLLALFVCLCACFSLCSCGGESSSLDILCELLAMGKYGTEGEACVYSSAAQEGEVGYFADELKIILYGEKRAAECFPLVEECAVYISPNKLEELAVFKCYSRSDTDSIAAMCLERADSLSVALNSIDSLNKNQKAHVEIHGRYVFFSFIDQSESLIKRFRELT